MSDCPAYDRVCSLALTRMASGSDAPVARIAADMRQNVEIAAFVYVVGVLAGLAVGALGIIF